MVSNSNWPSRSEDGSHRTAQALVLGLGSMLNHSSRHQNVGWRRDVDRRIMTYYAARDIRRGEELCISYGARLTFIDADAPEPSDDGDGTEVLGGIDLT